MLSNCFNNPSQQLRLPPCVKLSQLSKTFTADFYERNEMKSGQSNKYQHPTSWSPSDFLVVQLYNHEEKSRKTSNVIKTFYMLICLIIDLY